VSLPSDVDGSREDEASGYDQFTFRQYFKLLPLTNNTALQQYADNTQLFISLVLFSQGKLLLTFPIVSTDEVSVMQHIQYGIKIPVEIYNSSSLASFIEHLGKMHYFTCVFL